MALLNLSWNRKPFKEEGDRIFFSYDDKISMSIEYYDPEAANAKSTHPGIQKSLTNGKIKYQSKAFLPKVVEISLRH